MSGVTFTPLRRIAAPKGDVLHALKRTDTDFAGFGEAYFTTVNFTAVKGWRRHKIMILNLIVPVGIVRFATYDDTVGGHAANCMQMFTLSDHAERYGRLTVPPGMWLAFQGVGEHTNLILNIASIAHDPAESETRGLDEIACDWSL